LPLELEVFLVRPFLFSSGVFWDENRCYVFVQFIEQDVRQDRADYSTLRRSAQCFIPLPVFHVTCIEYFLDQANDSSVMDFFLEGCQDEFMVETLKTRGYVALNEPDGSRPFVVNLP